MRKIKIAQIGTSDNSHGNDIWKTLKELGDIFEICGYAMPENEREKFPERMKEFEGYTELTVDEIMQNPEIEAVIIETEEIYLTKYATLAAKYKKHIHMEKPGGTNLSDFEKLVDMVKENNKVFHIGYMYRYNPYVMELKEKIKNGELGDIMSVEVQMNCEHTDDLREWLGNLPGGIMFFLGCHLIDLIYSIQGEPEEIIPLNCSTGKNNIYTEDFGMVVLKYKNGVSFAKTNDTQIGGFERRYLAVSGSKATVELCPLETFVEGFTMYTEKKEYTEINRENNGVKTQSEPRDRYKAMIEGFASYVRGDSENPWNYDYELGLYKLILKGCGVKI